MSQPNTIICDVCKHPIMDIATAYKVDLFPIPIGGMLLQVRMMQAPTKVFVNVGVPIAEKDICGLNCLCRVVTIHANKITVEVNNANVTRNPTSQSST